MGLCNGPFSTKSPALRHLHVHALLDHVERERGAEVQECHGLEVVPGWVGREGKGKIKDNKKKKQERILECSI